jgi:hypothetical protein
MLPHGSGNFPWRIIACTDEDGRFKAREQAQLNSVVNNLRITEGAKDQWALENNQGTGALPVPRMSLLI